MTEAQKKHSGRNLKDQFSSELQQGYTPASNQYWAD